MRLSDLITLFIIFTPISCGNPPPEYITGPPPTSSYVSIDNGVLGEPEVRCGSEDISLHFQTAKPFLGKIFVKGHVNENECVQQGDNRITQSFTIRFDSCGVRRQREINGVVIIATVIVSFHSIFITKVDRAYRTSCFYMEAVKVVNQQIDVGSLTTEMIRNQVPIPTCRYEILTGGPSGNAVSFARIGDSVYHKWSCNSEVPDVYCMRVHSCTVYDGQGGTPVTVVDQNGCSVDQAILRQLNYNTDLTAGQDSLVFKFADKVGLYFNCQIQLTLKEKQYGCLAAQPECPSSYAQAQVEPSTRTSEEVEDRESLHRDREHEHESGYPTRPVPYTGTPTTRQYTSSHEESRESGLGSTPVTPSGYRYPSTTPRTSGERSNEEYVDLNNSRERPYAIKVNPFDKSGSSSSENTSPVPIPPTKEGSHPPGFKPNQRPANKNNGNHSSAEFTSTEYPGSGEEEDIHGSHEAGSAQRSSTARPGPEPYTRLIRRMARARSAGKTVESNSTNPLFVADFDLPERSLIVLGIEDGHDTQSLAQADRLFNTESSPIESCSAKALPLGYSVLIGCLLLVLSALIAVLFSIVYRQRKLLKNPIL